MVMFIARFGLSRSCTKCANEFELSVSSSPQQLLQNIYIFSPGPETIKIDLSSFCTLYQQIQPSRAFHDAKKR